MNCSFVLLLVLVLVLGFRFLLEEFEDEPLQTNTLSSDSLYFSDPQWTNYPARFYRLRSP